MLERRRRSRFKDFFLLICMEIWYLYTQEIQFREGYQGRRVQIGEFNCSILVGSAS
jgi:hypothetical protein